MSDLELLQISAIPRKKNKLISKIIITALFYICLLLFMYSDLANANVAADERATANVGVTSGTILAGLLLVGSAFYWDKEFRKYLASKLLGYYAVVVVAYTIIGWRISGSDSFGLRSDLLVALWVVGGLAMFRLIVRSYFPKLQLMALIAIGTYFIYYSLTLEISRVFAVQAGVSTRIIDLTAFQYSALLLIPTGIAICLFSRLGLVWKIGIWGLVFLHLFSLGFLSATRSAVLSLSIVVFCSVLALLVKVSDGVMIPKSVTASGRLFKTFLIVCFFLSIVIVVDSQANFTQPFRDRITQSMIYQRFVNPESAEKSSDVGRIDDAEAALESLESPLELLMGKGMGSSFWTPISGGYQTYSTHIGVLTFILKGGLILLIPCVYLLYINFPRLFLRSLFYPNAYDPKRRTALLTVLPGVFGWTTLLLISGGVERYSSVGVGLGIGAYLHFKKHGLNL